MARAAFLPWPVAAVMVRMPPITSPPAKMPGRPVISLWSTTIVSSRPISMSVSLRRKPRSACWPSASTSVSTGRISNSPVGWSEPSSPSAIRSIVTPSLPKRVGFRQPLRRDPLEEGLVGLLGFGAHVGAVAAVDQDRLLDVEALGDPRRIHRGIAAADHGDDPAEFRRHAPLDMLEERDRIDHLPAVGGRDVEVVALVRPDRDEAGVEAAFRHRRRSRPRRACPS